MQEKMYEDAEPLRKMELHAVRLVEIDTKLSLQIIRVFNGWIYTPLSYRSGNAYPTERGTSVFVPESLDVEALNDFATI